MNQQSWSVLDAHTLACMSALVLSSQAGIRVTIHRYLEDVSQPYLEAEVIKLCSDPTVDGVLIQLPLSKHLDEEAVMEKLDPKKDVDGFHPLNMVSKWFAILAVKVPFQMTAQFNRHECKTILMSHRVVC